MKRGRKSDRMVGLRNEFMKQVRAHGDFDWLCYVADICDRSVVDYLKKTELYYADKIGSGLYAVFEVDGIDDDMMRDSDYQWLTGFFSSLLRVVVSVEKTVRI